MASNQIRGCSYIVEADGTLIAGGENAVLTQDQETGRIVTKDNCKSASYVSGQRSWTLQDDTAYIAGGDLIHTETMGLAVGASPDTVKGINELSLNTTFSLLEASNTTSGLQRATDYGVGEHTLDFGGEFFSPLSDADNAGLQLLEASARSTAEIAFEFTFGSGLKFAGSGVVSNFTLNAPSEGYVTYSGTITISGDITPTTTGTDPGLLVVIDAVYTSQAKISVKLTTNVAGDDEWLGSAVAGTFSITATFGADIVRAAITFEGDGALTQQEHPV